MKILQVTSGYPPMLGGVEHSVYQLVTRLRSMNHDVRVITAGVSKSGLEDGVWRLPVTLKIERSWGDLLFCPSILSTIKKTPFELVHAHTPRKLFAEAVALYKLLARRKFPYIVSIRLLNTSLTGFWRGLADVYQKLVETTVFQHARFMVVQTEFNKEFVVQNFGIAPDKVHIIPNAVDTQVYDPDRIRTKQVRRKRELEDKKVVFFSGRLTAQKGVKYLLNAMQIVVKTVPNVVLLMAGEGPQEQLLKREASTLGIKSHVAFLGTIKYEEMPELYSIADVFVLPSLSESFPNAMLEAMAMRNPIVITRVGVAPEILENHKTAMLVEPADPAELADGLIELLTNNTLSKKLGQRAMRLVRTKYTWERVIDKTLKLYEAALS